jgi:hypothetical protein
MRALRAVAAALLLAAAATAAPTCAGGGGGGGGGGGACSLDGAAAELLYSAAPRWEEHAALQAALRTERPITALAVLPLGGAGGAVALGDAGGGVELRSARGTPLGRLAAGPAAVTALAAMPPRRRGGGGALLTGHADGSLGWHDVLNGGAGTLRFATRGGLTAGDGAGAAVVAIDLAVPPHAAHGVAAVLDAGGGVRLARVERGAGGSDAAPLQEIAAHAPASTAADRVVAVRALAGGVRGLTAGGGAVFLPSRGPARPPRGCTPPGAAAVELAAAAFDNAVPGRAFLAARAGSLLTALGAVGPADGCRAGASAELPAPLVALVALPGYLLAASADLELRLLNATARGEAPAPVASAPFAALGAAFGLARADAFAPGGAAAPTPLLAAAAAPGAAGAPGAPRANALLAVQLGPRVAAVYAAALPHRAPPAPGRQLGLLQLAHPFLLAAVVGAFVLRGRSRAKAAAGAGGALSAGLGALDTLGAGGAPGGDAALGELERLLGLETWRFDGRNRGGGNGGGGAKGAARVRLGAGADGVPSSRERLARRRADGKMAPSALPRELVDRAPPPGRSDDAGGDWAPVD